MRIEITNWKKKTTSVYLLLIFLLPIIYNPVHYLFIEHNHSIGESDPHFDSFHKTCKLDDFHLGESIDIGVYDSALWRSIIFNFKPIRTVKAFLSYRNFIFNLRAPPAKVFLHVAS